MSENILEISFGETSQTKEDLTKTTEYYRGLVDGISRFAWYEGDVQYIGREKLPLEEIIKPYKELVETRDQKEEEYKEERIARFHDHRDHRRGYS